ncbi:hypothetical protein PIB30_003768 [Stylosanthes scabra]|uniref:DUF4283 domain-containing protein n=1 Tax=Stylosanthes scabra TaxID=79078 RepID=A0ABU6R3W3_9FABA|nr:hypothetical protein [Stylosanthes scabra]
MGLLVCMWCEENIKRVAELWGKVVLHDDRSGESKSFTTARVMIDCYQWEMVNEWVSIKIENRTFDVFVKETSAEAYSVQAYPDLEREGSASMDELMSNSMVEETPIDDEQPSAVAERQNLNRFDDNDPQLIVILNAKGLEDVPSINSIDGMILNEIVEVEEAHRRGDSVYLHYNGCMGDMDYGLSETDPMVAEAQLTKLGENGLIEADGPERSESRFGCSDSSGSCPVPPGFGLLPGSDQWLGHCELARVPCEDRIGNVGGCANEEEETVDGGADSENSEKDESVETLYKINECMLLEWRKESDAVLEIVLVPEENLGVNGGVQGAADKTHYSVPEKSTDPGLNGDVDALLQGCSLGLDTSRRLEKGVLVVDADRNQNSDDDINEDDRFEEATASKGLWKRGSLLFDSSDDDEVLTRLFNSDPDNVKRATKKSKKQKKARKPPNIQGRTLATRKLLSGTKQKFR